MTAEGSQRPPSRADSTPTQHNVDPREHSRNRASTCGIGKHLLAWFPQQPIEKGNRNNMNSTTTSPDINKLQRSLKWSWAGPAGGIACMVALFIMGLVTQTPGMTFMAATLAAALGGMWVAIRASLRRKIAQAQPR